MKKSNDCKRLRKRKRGRKFREKKRKKLEDRMNKEGLNKKRKKKG